jgi:diguanylate cyclase (GGDEF)-like protein/PAS domain S-box-containing protein
LLLNFEKTKINIFSGLILIVLTLTASLSVYVIMKRHAELTLKKSYEILLHNEATSADTHINYTLNSTMTVATRILVIKNLQLLALKPDHATAQAELQSVAQSFLSVGLVGLSIVDVRGLELARAGVFSQGGKRIPLKTKYRAFVVWDKHFILQASQNILDIKGRRIGMVKTEATLPYLTKIFDSTSLITESGKLSLCAPTANNEKDMDCILSGVYKTDFKRLPRKTKDKILPMNYALNGVAGTISYQNYLGNYIVSAYAPVGALGIGMTIKTERSKLYQPTREQLKIILPILAALLMVGMAMQHLLVKPLVRKLVDAERLARQLNIDLSQFKNTLNQTLEAIFIFEIDTLRFTYVNQGAKRQTGYSETELMQMIPVDLKPEFTLEQYQQTIQPLIEGVLPSLTFETVHRHKDGHDMTVEISLQLVYLEDQGQGQSSHFLSVVNDISERKQTEQRIAHMANHDALTNLPNRHLLHDRIRQALLHARRNGSQGAVLFIDLDKFKAINDTMGHDVGDRLLKEVGRRLVSSLRSQDTVARTGGDEFVVVLHNVATGQDAGTTAQKLLNALLLPYWFAGKDLYISASIGIAMFPGDGEDVDTLLTHSDTAMYHAKESGRNNYQFFAL